MALEFKFPDVGEGIHEGRIVEWLVAEGGTVKVDRPFVKVETDKAVVDLPAPIAGVVLKRHFAVGDVIHVGQVLATFGTAGETPAVSDQHPALSTQTGQNAKLETRNAKFETAPAPARPPATPHTRALARKLGVDLARVTGTGPRGRITDKDVNQATVGGGSRPSAIASQPVAAGSPPAAIGKLQAPPPLSTLNSELSVSESVERVPITYLRKRIAEHMTASKAISAHVTHVDEADVTELYALYRQAKEEVQKTYDLHLTILPFFMKALVAALRKHPLINASYDAEKGELLYKKFYHIGIAVDTPEGLIVPVVKHVEHKNMLALASDLLTLGTKARERTLSLDELKGATITITNIGPIGGLFATPIINQPNLAILALGAVKDRPAVHEGAVALRKMIYFSLSFDHRIIDGAEAARFVVTLGRIVSNPGLLLAEM